MTNHEVKYNGLKRKVTNLKEVDENSNLSSENRKKSDFDLASYKFLEQMLNLGSEQKKNQERKNKKLELASKYLGDFFVAGSVFEKKYDNHNQ